VGVAVLLHDGEGPPPGRRMSKRVVGAEIEQALDLAVDLQGARRARPLPAGARWIFSGRIEQACAGRRSTDRGRPRLQQVGDADEAGDEGGLRLLVELAGRGQLLDPCPG
jgi:hypothetical protein